MNSARKLITDIKPLISRNTPTLHLIICVVLFLGVAYTYNYIYYFEGYQQRWGRCIYYILVDELYHGQPFCTSGPVNYYFSAILVSLIGWDLFQPAIITVNIILSLSLLLIGLKILSYEKSLSKAYILILLFIFWFYPETVTRFESILSTSLMGIGFYFFYYKKSSAKNVIAGLLFAISFHAKYSSGLPILLFFIYYFLAGIIGSKRKSVHLLQTIKSEFKEKWPVILRVLACFLPVFTLLSFDVLPRVLLYGGAFTGVDVQSTEKILDLLFGSEGLNILKIKIYLVLVAVIIGFKKNRDVYSFIALVGIIFTNLNLVVTHHQFPHSYQFLPTYFFILIALPLAYNKIQAKPILRGILLLAMFYLIFFNYQFVSLKLEQRMVLDFVDEGLSHMPVQVRHILVETHTSKKHLQRMISGEKQYTVIPYGSTLDTGFADSKMYGVLIDNQKILPTLWDEGYKMGIFNGDFDLIVLEPPEWFTVSSIVNSFYEMPSTRMGSSMRGYVSIFPQVNHCVVEFPNLYFTSRGGRHQSTLIFKDDQACSEFFWSMVKYYDSKFNEMCRIDDFLANNVVELNLKMNGLSLGRTCVEGGRYVDYYEERYGKFTILEVFDILKFFCVVGIIYLLIQMIRSGNVSTLSVILVIVLIFSLGYLQSIRTDAGRWYNPAAVVTDGNRSIMKYELADLQRDDLIRNPVFLLQREQRLGNP